MKILYEDKYLIVASKPPGVASQADPSGRPDMISLLREEGHGDVFCVHRLDTATAGVMVYAKTSQAAGKLSASLSAEDCKKQYLAIVHSPDAGAGEMRDLLFHDRKKNKAYVVDRQRNGVKEALLDYETLKSEDGLSLVRVTLHTGRTHQIRVQFASRRMPLCGDGKYGSRDNMPLCLHCFSLAFTHPFTKKRLAFTDPPDSPWNGFEIKNLSL